MEYMIGFWIKQNGSIIESKQIILNHLMSCVYLPYTVIHICKREEGCIMQKRSREEDKAY